MGGVFKGAIIESEVNNVCRSIDEAFKNYEVMQISASNYADQCLESADVLVDKILKRVK